MLTAPPVLNTMPQGATASCQRGRIEAAGLSRVMVIGGKSGGAIFSDEHDDTGINSTLVNPDDDDDESAGITSFETDEYGDEDEETDDED